MMKLLFWASTIISWAAQGACVNFFPRQPYATFDEAGSVYIAYDGAISAKAWYPPDCCILTEGDAGVIGCNGTGEPYGPVGKTQLFIGKNPKWDNNSWFFELYHSVSEDSYITNDTITVLDFASAVDSCWVDGMPCGYFNFDPTYIGETVLDLSKADVKQTDFDGNPGYMVTADSSTFLATANDSYLPSVDVDATCYLTDSKGNYQGTFSYDNFTWSPGTNFSYTLSFSNSSADMTIITHFNGSKMQLDFSGPRANNDSLAIELLTSDPTQPKFESIDGQAISFSSSTSSSPTPTMMPTDTPVTTTAAPTSTSSGAAVHAGLSANVALGSVAGSTLTGLLLALFA